MSTVFKHRDVDGDTFRVSEWHHPEVLSFEVIPEVDSTFVNMNRPDVERLYNALGEWLYPNEPGPKTPLPVRPAVSLTPADVRSIVAEQMAVVLPLHLAHLGTAQGNDPIPARYMPGFSGQARPCPECESASCRGVDCAWKMDDPTAKEAGHPDAPERDMPCCTHSRCGHGYTDHGSRGSLSATCLHPECGCTRYRSTR